MKDYRFQRWNEIKDGKINADILINGNSRAMSHFVPSEFDAVLNYKTYNLGFGGHPFNAQYLKYGYYINYNKKPQLLIQNVDFITLTDIFIIGHEREQILPFVYDDYLQQHLLHFGFSKIELYLPLIRYFGYQQVIKNGMFEFLTLKHYNNKMAVQGFIPEKGNWNPTELNKIENLEFSRDSFTVNLFDKYLSELKNDNIEVVLVNSPVYYKATEKLLDREVMNEFYKKIARKYNFTYLDYTSDSLCFDSTMFVMAVHLNEFGAKKFSHKLAIDLKKMELLKNK